MLEPNIKLNSINKVKVQSDHSPEEIIHKYEISELHKEIEYLNQRLALVPRMVQIACKEIRQFWWTCTSVIGLGWLHDGSRIIKPELTREPTVKMPCVALKHMPSPRLFLDVTATYRTKLNTGVQRVVREICRHGVAEGSLAPIINNDGEFVAVTDFTPINFEHGDRILLLDSCWTLTNIYPNALQKARGQGAELILGIYDLIPIQHTGFVTPNFTIIFEHWLKTITPYCTNVLAISRYSAESFLNWASQNEVHNQISALGWFHLGANIPDFTQLNGFEYPENEMIPNNYMLSVGTIEPRKGYSVSLDAFERLWLNGSTLSYVIIGRRGTLGSHISHRILTHKQFGKRLFWPQNIDDYLLAQYYKKSLGVIIPALAEGFGLPLIESSFYGKPVIASDLPVFKEIAQEGVIFFSTADSAKLALSIENILAAEPIGLSKSLQDWSNSTNDMIRIIKNNAYQIKLQ